MQAEQLLRAGNLDECLAELQKQVRSDPSNAKLRVFLFQVYCVRGEWEKALTQLNVAGELDAANLLMVQVYRPALMCEALRAEVFAGGRTPLVFGEPPQWIGLLIQANQHVAQRNYRAAQELREQAFEAAPAAAGSIDGKPFTWIADADTRLGPVLEAIIDGKYYWVPFTCIRQVRFEAPANLRDTVWALGQFIWSNGGDSIGLIPTRYPGSEADPDAAVQMARLTKWIECEGSTFIGQGQRMLATDAGEFMLLDVRRLMIGPDAESRGGDVAGGGA